MSATAGRPYPKHTKIGKAMADRGLKAFDVASGTGIYTRTLSDILSGRQRPTPAQMAKLSAYFRMSPESLTEAAYPHLASDRLAGVA